MSHDRFDESFYRRFYSTAKTRVTSREEMRRLGNEVAAIVQRLEIPVRRILDAGCGLGWLRAPLLKAWPNASYTGIEVSEYLCKRHGWTHASLADFRPRGQFDLVICNDVLQYLSDRDAVRACAALGRLCRGALYFNVPTRGDWQRNADRSVSDANIRLRSAKWYRDRLDERFHHVGRGVHVRRSVSIVEWEMEQENG
jgi:trans-aconitate methyltransferase